MKRIGNILVIAALLTTLGSWLMLTPSVEAGKRQEPTPIYIAIDGHDYAGDGSIDRPYRTLARAARLATPGTQILVRGGFYPATSEWISPQGTRRNPIVIKPYNNESVVFDGAGAGLARYQSIITLGNAKHVVVEGFEISNSTGRGLSFFESENITIRNNRVHDISSRAIGGGGHKIVIENNVVWNAVMENANEAFQLRGGWAAAIRTFSRADDSPSTNITIQNNHVHSVWGEGIVALFATDVKILGNNIHDSYGANIYIDNAQQVIVKDNYLHTTSALYNRSDRQMPADGIGIANEVYATHPNTPTQDIKIINNQIDGTGRGIRYWQALENSATNNSYSNVIIKLNQVNNTHGTPVSFDMVGASFVQPTNNVITNNQVTAGLNGETISIGNLDGWRIGRN